MQPVQFWVGKVRSNRLTAATVMPVEWCIIWLCIMWLSRYCPRVHIISMHVTSNYSVSLSIRTIGRHLKLKRKEKNDHLAPLWKRVQLSELGSRSSLIQTAEQLTNTSTGVHAEEIWVAAVDEHVSRHDVDDTRGAVVWHSCWQSNVTSVLQVRVEHVDGRAAAHDDAAGPVDVDTEVLDVHRQTPNDFQLRQKLVYGNVRDARSWYNHFNNLLGHKMTVAWWLGTNASQQKTIMYLAYLFTLISEVGNSFQPDTRSRYEIEYIGLELL